MAEQGLRGIAGRIEDRPAANRRDSRTAHRRLGRLARLPYRYQPWRPRHIRLVLRDFARPSERLARDDRSHLAAALEWLCLAQDVCKGRADAGGVSAGWSFEDGWLPGYPETTGYIIETFIEAAEALNAPI